MRQHCDLHSILLTGHVAAARHIHVLMTGEVVEGRDALRVVGRAGVVLRALRGLHGIENLDRVECRIRLDEGIALIIG